MKCPICEKELDSSYWGSPVTYHISYNPVKAIITCRQCNFLEYLVRTLGPEKIRTIFWRIHQLPTGKDIVAQPKASILS